MIGPAILLSLAVGAVVGFMVGHQRGHSYGVAKMLAALTAVDEMIAKDTEIPPVQRRFAHTLIQQFLVAVQRKG